MREQPMFVTALVLFALLMIAVRPNPMVDRDHNGIDDKEQILVYADDGYFYAHISRFSDYGADLKSGDEVVDAEWIRWKIADDTEWVGAKMPNGRMRITLRPKDATNGPWDYTNWVNLEDLEGNPYAETNKDDLMVIDAPAQ